MCRPRSQNQAAEPILGIEDAVLATSKKGRPSTWRIYPLVMTNSSPWFVDGPNRNRWFTELNSMVDLSMAMLVITRWYTYIFHVVLFSAVAPKGRNFSSCKEKFFCKKNAVVKNVSPCGRVMSPLGRVMSPFGRAMSPLQNHIFKTIWKISKNAVPQKKCCSFGKPIFRVKGRNLAPFWRCRYMEWHWVIHISSSNVTSRHLSQTVDSNEGHVWSP